MNTFIPTEAQDAANLAEYLDLLQRTGRVLLFSHIPNETYTTSWSAKRRNKIQGVRKGVPDYIIITSENVIFLELKRMGKGTSVSSEQKEWIIQLNNKQTISTIARGFDQAKEFIDGLLLERG